MGRYRVIAVTPERKIPAKAGIFVFCSFVRRAYLPRAIKKPSDGAKKAAPVTALVKRSR